jgi:phosphonoacetaldehyde hydrolase
MSRLEAVIFDWAGTTVDHGSLAPLRAITELFRLQGILLDAEDGRRDMGIYKKDHIRRILELPKVRTKWSDTHGEMPGEKDVDRLFTEFIPLQLEVLAEHSRVIGGVAETTERLRRRGLRIGSTTGYTRPMLDILLASAAREGYHPEISLCPDDTGAGRPYPWMCLRIALELRIGATSAAVKIGDTVSDIQEGLNAGMWTVGVTATGNGTGLDAQELEALPAHERKLLLEKAGDAFTRAGAHYVVSRVAAIEPVLDDIELRLALGERP